LLGSNEYSCTFRLFDTKKIYLVIEKDCYFMVEPVDPSQQQENPHYAVGVKSAREDTSSQYLQQPPSLVESSNGNFDKKEFLDIFNYKSEVEESNVISVERGSQIRKPNTPTPSLLDTLGSLNTPKFNSAVAQQFPCPQEFDQNEDRMDHERTFID
jgi:hypothetical protein